MLKKQILYGIIFFGVMLILFPSSVYASEEEEEVTNDLLDSLHMDTLENHWEQLTSEYGVYMDDLNNRTLLEVIKDKESLSLTNVLQGFIEFIFYEVIASGKMLSMLILLTLFSVVLQTMHTAFEQSMVSKIAYFVVYIALLYIALNSFYSAFSYTTDAISMMSSFMIGMIPLLLGLLATFGNVGSISFFHPIILFIVHSSGVLVSSFILPLLYLSALLFIVSTLHSTYKVTHLAEMLKTISLTVLMVFFTLFIGVISIQGTASAVQDGVAMKTAKFITGNAIPIVGRTFTDAADTILTASLLLKNAVGIVGVLIILFIALFPAIKIAIIALMYKLTAAILQPIGGGPVVESLQIISKFMMYILASLLVVALMFFLSIVIILVASNVTLFLR